MWNDAKIKYNTFKKKAYLCKLSLSCSAGRCKNMLEFVFQTEFKKVPRYLEYQVLVPGQHGPWRPGALTNTKLNLYYSTVNGANNNI